MTRSLSLLSVGSVALLVACGADDPGVLTHGIVEGQNQTVVAGTKSLSKGVTWALTRTKDGKLALVRERAIDAMLPRVAYAQTGPTVVKGSPVPGAVVCADATQGLTPFVPCTNTDANGKATFFFTPTDEKRAKCVLSEIRGTLNNAPAVFDTAKACVLPTIVNDAFWFAPIKQFASPFTVPDAYVGDIYGNAVPFTVVGDASISVAAPRTLTWGALAIDSTWRTLDVRDSTSVTIAHLSYRIIADDCNCSTKGQKALEWHTYGLKRSRTGATLP